MKDKIELEILNGCCKTGIAKIFEHILSKEGFDVVNTDNYIEKGRIRWDVAVSRVIDLTGHIDQAEKVADILGIDRKNVNSLASSSEIYDVRVIIGRDFQNLASFKSFAK